MKFKAFFVGKAFFFYSSGGQESRNCLIQEEQVLIYRQLEVWYNKGWGCDRGRGAQIPL